DFFKANTPCFDKTRIEANLLQNKDILVESVTDAVEEEFGKFECLSTILHTLTSIDKRKLKFSNDLTKLIFDNLQRLYNTFYIVEPERTVLLDLCSLFGQTLAQKEAPTTDTPLTVENLRLYVQNDPLCHKLRSEIEPRYNITGVRRRGSVFLDNPSDYPKLIDTLKNRDIKNMEALQREMLSHRENMILCFSKAPKREVV